MSLIMFLSIRCIFCLLVLFFLNNPLFYSQVNLVPNYSFENYSSCPTGGSQINLATSWFNPDNANFTSTPDYFNVCSASVSIPRNPLGYQNPQTENAYAGIFTFPAINSREYIEVQLYDSLKKGQKYCTKFYVSLANISGYAIDAIGAYLSKDSILNNNGTNFNYLPQLSNASQNILSDTLNWIEIADTIVAKGGEQFITIGNFKDDLSTYVKTVNNSCICAYYYIDDVSVVLMDSNSTCGTVIVPPVITDLQAPNVFTPNGDGVNDEFVIGAANMKEVGCTIYNRWGEVVEVGSWQTAVGNKSITVWDGRNNSGIECTEGVYYYIVTAKDNNGKDYEEKGNVSLIR